MSDAAQPRFDPAKFFEIARNVGHGRALGLEYRDSGPDWAELALPWRKELVGVREGGILASGAIVSLIDTASGTAYAVVSNTFEPGWSTPVLRQSPPALPPARGRGPAARRRHRQ